MDKPKLRFDRDFYIAYFKEMKPDKKWKGDIEILLMCIINEDDILTFDEVDERIEKFLGIKLDKK